MNVRLAKEMTSQVKEIVDVYYVFYGVYGWKVTVGVLREHFCVPDFGSRTHCLLYVQGLIDSFLEFFLNVCTHHYAFVSTPYWKKNTI